jgi:hypothetical protein
LALVAIAEAEGVKPVGMGPPFSSESKLKKRPQLLDPEAVNTDTISGTGLLRVKDRS